jgi:hypothetical protein
MTADAATRDVASNVGSVRRRLVVCSRCRSVPADNGRENRMAGFLFKLETTDGIPAEQSSLSSAVPNWGPGHTIHFGHKTLRVVAVRDDDADSPPVLVVEEAD